MTIHHRKFPFVRCSSKFPFICGSLIMPSPKWSLLFDPDNKHYTEPFRANIALKIEEWLDKQKGKDLIVICKDRKKDDYFNLIQFYLRERFPTVAVFEKKQNATIVLNRSLSLIFICNILLYFLFLFVALQEGVNLTFSLKAIYWIAANISFAIVLYNRFQQDKIYHAMYIFETFIATKKLLKSGKQGTAGKQGANHD